jgi:hypothetical protein
MRLTFILTLSLGLDFGRLTYGFLTSTERHHLGGRPDDATYLSRRGSRVRNAARSADELIEMAREFVLSPTSEKLSEDFVFRGPVIGPFCKKDYVAALESMGSAGKAGLTDAFPDLEQNMFGFTVDPVETNRVWYFVRPRGTFLGPFDHPISGRIEPTGAKYIAPPEARSIVFDDEGKVKYSTVGYVMDRFTGDTTKGKAAVFGMYEAMGQGEGMDDTIGSSKMVFLQWLTSVLPESLGFPKSYSKKESLPSWWRDERMGSQK